MKISIKELLQIPKQEKLPENVMLARIGISVAIILFCLAAMSFSAFAYFSHSITSASNQMTTATYKLEVTVNEPLAEQAGLYVIENTTAEDKTYAFTLRCSDTTTASVGYGKIAVVTDYEVSDSTLRLKNGTTLSNLQYFYTKPIWKTNADDPTKSVEYDVNITVKAGKTLSVMFLSEWGSCTMPPFESGTALDIKYAETGSGVQQNGATDQASTDPASQTNQASSDQTPTESNTEQTLENTEQSADTNSSSEQTDSSTDVTTGDQSSDPNPTQD